MTRRTGYKSPTNCTWIGPAAINPSDVPVIKVERVGLRYFPDRLVSFGVAVDPNGPRLNGTTALVNARVLVPIPAGTAFVRAEPDNLSPDITQPWSYSPTTGVWVLPPSARFINTLVITVRVTTAPATLTFTGRLLSWQGNTNPSQIQFSQSSFMTRADAAVTRPANDDMGSPQALMGDQGSTTGTLDYATSPHTPSVGNAPAVVDIPGLPPKNYQVGVFSFDATRAGSLNLDLRTTSPTYSAPMRSPSTTPAVRSSSAPDLATAFRQPAVRSP